MFGESNARGEGRPGGPRLPTNPSQRVGAQTGMRTGAQVHRRCSIVLREGLECPGPSRGSSQEFRDWNFRADEFVANESSGLFDLATCGRSSPGPPGASAGASGRRAVHQPRWNGDGEDKHENVIVLNVVALVARRCGRGGLCTHA